MQEEDRRAGVVGRVLFGASLHVPRAVSTYVPQLFLDDPAALQDARAGLTSLFVAVGMWGAAWIVAGSLSGGPKAASRGARHEVG